MASSYVGWNYGKWSPTNISVSTIRAGVDFDKPWAYRCAIGSKRCPDNMPGVNVEFFKRLMLRLSLKYRLLPCSQTTFNEHEISGCAKQLIDKQIDVIVGPSGYSQFRDNYVDFTRPVVYFRFGALIAKKRSLPVVENPMKERCGAILVLLTTFVFADFIFSQLLRRRVSTGILLIFSTTFLVFIMVLESSAFILYNNLMTSRALGPRVIYPFLSFDQLVLQVLSGERTLLGLENFNNPERAYWQYFSPVLYVKQSYYEQLKRFLSVPDTIKLAVDHPKEKYLLEDTKLTYVASAPSMEFAAAQDPRMLAISETRIRETKWFSFMVQNGSDLKMMLSDAILHEIMNLQYTKLIDKYIKHERQFQVTSDEPLTLLSLYVPILMYILGISISICYLSVESVARMPIGRHQFNLFLTFRGKIGNRV